MVTKTFIFFISHTFVLYVKLVKASLCVKDDFVLEPVSQENKSFLGTSRIVLRRKYNYLLLRLQLYFAFFFYYWDIVL